ncbi:epimerase [Rhodothalassium salexigens]|uniref:NAD-dependent epimerase/dehydratase family protein n=1 Tax=Rhodothalassium salexigens TaxID=1086 RepID=UPI0019126B3C|nr:NAD-dependent epimerase/dehydratase family protein [Rhodothalassium salexigens]MBK5920503.1 epimerase [Rhodothalassium salexigens]
MRWLITGGCGFIGRMLIRRLVDEGGHAIRVVDNLSVGQPDALTAFTALTREDAERPGPMTDTPGVTLIEADIRDAAAMARVVDGAEVIVHLAANTGVEPSVKDPMFDCESNVTGTLNMLEAARHAGTDTFVFASSGAPAGEVEPPIHEELAPHPVSPYGASKLAGEGYCSAYARTFGVKTVCLRFGNVYGPGSTHKSSVVAKFIRRALAGEKLEIYGDGAQTRDYIFITDLVDAIVKAATVPDVGGEVFQIATAAETSVGEMVDKLLPVLEAHGVARPEVIHGAPRQGDVMRNYSDTSKARRMLGWQATHDLDAGLPKTVAWFTTPAGDA